MSVLDAPSNNCYVCGPGNPVGLGLKFRLDDDGVCRSAFTPDANHCGWNGVTHGGIIFSLLDDVMANLIWLQGEACFTARCEIRYREALPTGTAVLLEGRLLRRRGRMAEVQGQVLRADNQLVVAETQAKFMITPVPQA